MPHVSRYKHSREIEEKLVNSLSTAFSKIGDATDMSGFLNTLLTDTEKIMLAKRFAVLILVEEKISDSEIANMLHLTRMTVAKIRYFYEARGKGFKIAFDKMEKQNLLESTKKFLSTLSE